MKLARIFILLTMAGVVSVMVCGPLIGDSKRRAIAFRHYVASPGGEMQKEIDVAKAADRRFNLGLESVLGLMLITLGFLFYKVGKNRAAIAAEVKGKK